MRQPACRVTRRPSRLGAASLILTIAAVVTIAGGTLTLTARGPTSTDRTPGVLMAPQRWTHPSSDLHAG